MRKDKFEKLLQKQLDKIPYTKHVDDGQYNDGVLDGFEQGARWFYEANKTNTHYKFPKGREQRFNCDCGNTITVVTNKYDNSNSGKATCKCGAEVYIN